ncbi:MAG: energy-coupling factor transporter transmembrane component T family protein, partial [Anaerolineae bacterium]
MQDFALLRHITIGQYLPGDSLVHRMDPRVKITVVLLLALALTVNTSYLANILLLALCLSLIRAAGLSLRFVLSSVRPALPFIIVLSLMQLAFYGDPAVTTSLPAVTFLHWGPIFITSNGLQLVLVSLARFVDLMILASVLTNTTPLAHLAYGMEDMLRPFGRLGVPAHEVSLIFILSLRFVPILAEQLETLAKAQASRGADLGAGGRWRFWRTARARLVLLVPLFL